MTLFGNINVVVNTTLKYGHAKLFKDGEFVIDVDLRKVQSLPDCDKIELCELDYADLKRNVKFQS